MLVKFTNASASKIHIPSLGPKNIAPGGYVETSRSFSDLEGDSALKVMVETGVVTLTFTKEDGDDAGLLYGQVPAAYSNTTRPAAAAVPIFSHIWNTDDNAINWSDGADWRDAAGVVT